MKLHYYGTGTVNFNYKKYGCDLYLNEKQGGIRIKLSHYHQKIFGNFLELPLEIQSLDGELSSGFRFLLINCTRCSTEDLISEGRSCYSYYAQYLIKGINSETNFEKIDYELQGILNWGEISGYKENDSHGINYSDEGEIEKLIFENNEFSIIYRVSSSMLPLDLLEESITLHQHGHLLINFQKPKPIEKFTSIFNQIRSLIELSILKPVYVNRITGFSEEIYDTYGDHKYERDIEIVSYQLRKNKTSNDRATAIYGWIKLPELVKNNSFYNYFLKYEHLKPILELYLSTIKSETMSPVRTFLNLVQALEIFHSRFKSNGRLKEFKTRIDTVILKNVPTCNVPGWKDFLMARSKNFITLESRLADLLLAEFEIRFDTGDIKYENFPNVITNTRNYYIHYDEMIKVRGEILAEKELMLYNDTLFYILEYYLLKELGFGVNEIKEKLKKRWPSDISTSLSLHRMSEQQKHS